MAKSEVVLSSRQIDNGTARQPDRRLCYITTQMAMAVRALICAEALFFGYCCAIAFQGPLLTTRLPAPRGRVEAPQANIRVDAALVLIPVHATTADGASVTSLSKENFRLFEDDVEQKITYFAKDDAPISLGLLLDTSGSMHNKIRRSSEAATTFCRNSNPETSSF